MGADFCRSCPLGVVIGFVLSYRVSSGYDRYWLGRSYWSDIVRDTRTLSRLIWFHIPLSLSSKKDEETTPEVAIERVMREKKMALDLVIGFAVALKHYLRGESIKRLGLLHVKKPLMVLL